MAEAVSMPRGWTRLTARGAAWAPRAKLQEPHLAAGSRDRGVPQSMQSTYRLCSSVTQSEQTTTGREHCRRRPSPAAVVAGEGALSGGEAEFGRLPRADWQATAFSAFLPLCLEDSRAPPPPISAPIPLLALRLSIELLFYSLPLHRQVCLNRSHIYPSRAQQSTHPT
jgi:hypothetical protein